MMQGGAHHDPSTGLNSILGDGQAATYAAGFTALPTVEAVILAVLAGIVTWAAINDLISTRIPNTANAAILLLWIGWAIVNPGVAMLYSLGIGIGLFAVGALLFHFRLMGGGDVKFLAVLGLFAGPQHILPFLIYVSVFGGVLCLLALVMARFPVPVFTLVTMTHGKRTVPYGVAIAASAYVMIVGIWSG